MSCDYEIENLQSTIASAEAAKRRLEMMTRASKLMREAAGILIELPPSERTSGAAMKLADACAILAGPERAEEDAR